MHCNSGGDLAEVTTRARITLKQTKSPSQSLLADKTAPSVEAARLSLG